MAICVCCLPTAGLRRPPSTLPLLTSLNVSHGSLRDADLPPSHQLLQSLPVLTDLNLDSCPIGTSGSPSHPYDRPSDPDFTGLAASSGRARDWVTVV